MGRVMRIACVSCNKEWQCRTGCGLSHARLEDVLREFSNEISRKVPDRVRKEEFPIFDFAYHMAVCDICKDVVSVPVLRLADGDLEYSGTCPVCRKEARRISDTDAADCPVCGKRMRQPEEIGRWD